MRPLISVIGLAALAMCSACGARPPLPPTPLLEPIPQELRPLAIHVHVLATPAETPDDDWDYHHMPGYTAGLRQAVQLQLTRAGYVVVVDRRSPRDLVALVHASWPTDRPGVASLSLTSSDGTLVDQCSAEVPVVREGSTVRHLENHAAIALVNAITRSRAVAEFARSRAPAEGAPLTAPSLEPTPPGETSPAPKPPRPSAIVLPPMEDACAADDDCGVTSLDLSGPTVCCFRCCSMHGGSKSWVKRVESICQNAPGLKCQPAACACPSPPYKPKCVSGRCTLTY
jgi:hypothetical protein